MRMTFSLPDALAHRFRANIPPRKRSSTVAKLIEQEMMTQERNLEAACLAANNDETLTEEVGEWQGFEDELEE